MVLMIFMKDLGTSLLFFGALLALLYVATGRFFYVVVGLVLFFAGATVLCTSSSPTCRPGWTSGSTPGRTRRGKGYQIVQSLFALAAGGLFGRGLGQGYLILQSGNTIIPALETDFIFSAIGEELGLGGRGGHHPAVPHLHLPGLPHGRAGPRRLLPAAGHRAHQHLRAAGLPHHGRGHQADPAHRHHPALRELRRQLDRGQLRPAGPAPADERPGGTSRPAAARGRLPSRGDGWLHPPALLFFALLFVALLAQLTYVQVWAAPKLKINAANTRAIEEEMKVERGLILSADGVELAVNHKEGQYFLREYPAGQPHLALAGLQQPAVRPGRGRAGLQRGALRAVRAAGRHQLLGPARSASPSGGPTSS